MLRKLSILLIALFTLSVSTHPVLSEVLLSTRQSNNDASVVTQIGEFYQPLVTSTVRFWSGVGSKTLDYGDKLSYGIEAIGNTIFASTVLGLDNSAHALGGFIADSSASIANGTNHLGRAGVSVLDSASSVVRIPSLAIDTLGGVGEFYLDSTKGAISDFVDVQNDFGHTLINSHVSLLENSVSTLANAHDAVGEATDSLGGSIAEVVVKTIKSAKTHRATSNSVASVGSIWSSFIDTLSNPLVPIFYQAPNISISLGGNKNSGVGSNTSIVNNSTGNTSSNKSSVQTIIQRISTPGITHEELVSSLDALRTELLALNASTRSFAAEAAAHASGNSSYNVSNNITSGTTNAGDLTGTLAVVNGGTGLNTAPNYGELLMGDGTGAYTLVATSSLGFTSGPTLWNTSGSDIYYDLGNVAIGSTPTTARLSVIGDGNTPLELGSWSAGGGANYAALYLNGDFSTDVNYNIVSSASDKDLYINRPLGNAMHFRENNDSDQMTILSGGNVGVGTDNPVSKFVVAGGGSEIEFNPGMYWDGGTMQSNSDYSNIDIPGTKNLNFSDNVSFTGGNVGIGTFNQDEGALKVNGSVYSTADETDDVLNGSVPGWQNKANFIGSGAWWGLRTGTDHSFNLDMLASNALTVKQNGNVGIGTTTPSVMLSVAGGINAEGMINVVGSNSAAANLVLEDDINGYAGVDVYSYQTTGSPYSYLNVVGSRGTRSAPSQLLTGDTLGELNFYGMGDSMMPLLGARISSVAESDFDSNPYANLIFSTDNTERMRIANNGNIGIGTASPSYMLDIAGTIQATSTVLNNGDSGVTSYIYGANNGLGGYTRTKITGVSGELSFQPEAAGGNGAYMGVSFKDVNANLVLGIPTSPSADLNIAGGLYLAQSSAAANLYTPGYAKDFNFNNGKVVFAGSGNVGIGTTTPWGQLSVNPNALGSGVPEFVVGSSTATHFVVDGAGNVGIGNSSPKAQLHVGPTYTNAGVGANSSVAVFAKSGSSGSTVYPLTLADTAPLATGNEVAFTYNLCSTCSPSAQISAYSTTLNTGKADLRFLTYNGSALAEVTRMTNDGKFGISSSTPWGQLSVNPDALGSGVPEFVVGSSTATHLIVTGGGNVGIGTSNPSTRFEVKAGAIDTNVFSFLNTSGTQIARIYASNGNGALLSLFKDDTTENVRFISNGNSFVKGGYLGIGTSTPAFPLDVYSTVSSNQSYGFLNSSGTVGTASGATNYSIRAEGRILASEFNAVSDARLKDVQFDLDTSVALNAIMGLKPVSFTWKNNPNGQPIIGFLAQDVETVIPNAVSRIATSNFPDQRELSYAQITAVSVGAIKQLNIKIDSILASSTPIMGAPVGSFWKSVGDHVGSWLASATNGITDIFSNTSHQKTLCVGDPGNETCLTKNELDAILLKANQAVTTHGPTTPTTPPADNMSSTTDTVVNNEPVSTDTSTSTDQTTGNAQDDSTTTSSDSAPTEVVPAPEPTPTSTDAPVE